MTWRKLLYSLFLILSLGFLGSVLIAFIYGYRAFFVSTPSMGMTAPVGTLIVTKSGADYQVDDIIAFYYQDQIYTHRIVKSQADGFTTKGDLNAAEDAWVIRSADIIGRSVIIMHHIGWLWKALPMFIIGMTIVWLISILKKIHPYWRWPIRLIGLAVVVTIITIWLRPWLSFGVLSVTPRNDQAVDMRIINTGIFTIKAQDLKLVSGQDGVVKVTTLDDKGRFILVPRPSLSMAEMVFAVIFCLTPLLIALLVELPQTGNIRTVGSRLAKRRRKIIMLIIGGTVSLLVLQFSSLASIVATVENQSNKSQTASYFTCGNAMQYGLPRPVAAYGMNQRPSFWSAQTENDLATNNNRGEYRRNVRLYSGYDDGGGCKRDEPQKALFFNGEVDKQCLVIPKLYRYQNITSFSLEIWFKTNSRGNNNGKLIGFGDTKFEDNSRNDRHIYLDKDGRLVFGTYRNQVFTLASPAGKNYADNQWHHVVATFSSVAGSRLYVDGEEVASDPNMRQAQDYNGYWRMGCGRLAGWRNADGTPLNGQNFFYGNLQFGAVYHSVMTAERVRDRFIAGN